MYTCTLMLHNIHLEVLLNKRKVYYENIYNKFIATPNINVKYQEVILNITLCLNPLFTTFLHSQSFNSGSYIKITRIFHYRHTKRTTLYIHYV